MSGSGKYLAKFFDCEFGQELSSSQQGDLPTVKDILYHYIHFCRVVHQDKLLFKPNLKFIISELSSAIIDQYEVLGIPQNIILGETTRETKLFRQLQRFHDVAKGIGGKRRKLELEASLNSIFDIIKCRCKVHIMCTCPENKKIPEDKILFVKNQRDRGKDEVSTSALNEFKEKKKKEKESKIEAEQTRRSLKLKINNSNRLKRLASFLSCLNGVDRVPCENGNLPTCNGIMKHYIFLCKENGEDNIPYVSNDNLFASNIASKVKKIWISEEFGFCFRENILLSDEEVASKILKLVKFLKNVKRETRQDRMIVPTLLSVLDILKCSCLMLRCSQAACFEKNCQNIHMTVCQCPVDEKIPVDRLKFVKEQRMIGSDPKFSSIFTKEAEAEKLMLHYALKQGIVKMIGRKITEEDKDSEERDSVTDDFEKGIKMESIDIKSEFLEAESLSNNVQESFVKKENDSEDLDKIDDMIEDKEEGLEKELIATKSECQRTEIRTLKLKKPNTKNSTNNAVVNSNNLKSDGVNKMAQQLKLASGELLWALPIGKEPIPGSKKNRIKYKVLGPVVPGQPPPTITLRPKAASEGGAPTSGIRASSPTSVPVYKSQQQMHFRGQSVENENNVKISDKIEFMHEDMEGGLKMESIDIKMECLEPDTFSSTESNDSKNDDHFVLFKTENHDPNNLIKQELEEDPLSQ